MGEAVEAGPTECSSSGYDAISAVLRDPGFRVSDTDTFDSFSDEWRQNPVFVQGADWILNLNAPRHPRIRSLIARAFTPRRIAGLEPAIEKMADDLLDAMADRGADGSAVEFMHDFAYLLPVTVICELIGIPEADREDFRPLARDLAGRLRAHRPGDHARDQTPPPSSCSPTSPGWPPSGAPTRAMTCSAT